VTQLYVTIIVCRLQPTPLWRHLHSPLSPSKLDSAGHSSSSCCLPSHPTTPLTPTPNPKNAISKIISTPPQIHHQAPQASINHIPIHRRYLRIRCCFSSWSSCRKILPSRCGWTHGPATMACYACYDAIYTSNIVDINSDMVDWAFSSAMEAEIGVHPAPEILLQCCSRAHTKQE